MDDPAGVSIDIFCRLSSSPQVAVAGCTGRDGAALTGASSACGACSGGFFLFRGGCYSQTGTPGSEICTAAEGGKCTTCKTEGNYIFQNRAATVTLGNECILCSDATDKNGVTGVANCNKCTAPSGNTGSATCSACQDGYYLNDADKTCKPCNGCATCENAADRCTSCPEGKYLKSDNTCVDAGKCDQGTYADKQSGECKACSTIDANCGACKYNATVSKPQCTDCGSKKVKTALDGTTTCVDVASNCVDSDHFKDDGNTMCVLCSDTSGTDPNKGVAQCKACTKTGSAKPVCTDCLEGYIKEGSDAAATCQACGTGCATCATKTENTQCQTCKSGFFLKGTAPSECVACDDTAKGGIDGCAECSGTAEALKCTKCKANYKQSESSPVICTKVCEDETACGGTAGACDAIVLGASGEMTYYCSLCGDSTKIPIDGKCVDSNQKQQNTCENGVCPQCTDGYFLYMGGCYKADQPPGNLMCTAAAGGICTTTTGQYFKVPGAKASQQSVLACGNPLGTTVGDNAYVGIQGCRTCTAPSEASNGATAPARCTACDGSKKPTGSGYGCVTCSVPGCSACRADNACEACGDGYRLEGGTCVRTGGNLSTGAIAGISVTTVVICSVLLIGHLSL